MYRTLLITYIENNGKEEQIAVRVKNTKDFKSFTKDMNVIGYNDVSKWDSTTQQLNARLRAGESNVEQTWEGLAPVRNAAPQWKGRGIGSLYNK